MIEQLIAQEINCAPKQVQAAVALLDEGATVPFIARYRKEVTGGLDDTQLRQLQVRLLYLRELIARKQTILKSIKEQGKLSDELAQKIEQCMSKSELEDIYLPFKPKRRTKAQIAIEAGLLPLAELLLSQPNQTLEDCAKDFINIEHKIEDTAAALDGAKQIIMEQMSEHSDVRQQTRQLLWQHGILKTQALDSSKADAQKFSDYFEYDEAIAKIPSHRALAIFRGRKLEILKANLVLEENIIQQCLEIIADYFAITRNETEIGRWLWQAIDWTWRIKLATKLEIDCLVELREQAEKQAIDVFAENLNHLLMASPAGAKVTMGLDPGFRTGVKMVVIDATGKLLHHETIFPHPPQNQFDKSLHTLALAAQKYAVELIAIGNGTASRETDSLVSQLIKKYPDANLKKIVISEAGASVYSASELAAKEFPSLDVSYRGAVSIARRLQDPLAELVKIDPKAIGVGQYQHDVNQSQLAQSLDAVVEDCVNRVGVDLNTASAHLLAHISGLNSTLANNIVDYRNQHGRFNAREALKDVPRMGDKTFQLAAGFLRIREGSNPLDASGVHPESYSVVERIQLQAKLDVTQLIGNHEVLAQLVPSKLADDQFGVPTIKDIIAELDKPGRDPRPDFVMPNFDESITQISDLKSGMQLEGTVSNVTHFGAFVDLGVHQDGLVHKSEMADKYVENPADVVKVGDIVKVTVVTVDVARKRIGLTMRSKAKTTDKVQTQASAADTKNYRKAQSKSNKNKQTAMGQALADLLGR